MSKRNTEEAKKELLGKGTMDECIGVMLNSREFSKKVKMDDEERRRWAVYKFRFNHGNLSNEVKESLLNRYGYKKVVEREVVPSVWEKK